MLDSHGAERAPSGGRDGVIFRRKEAPRMLDYYVLSAPDPIRPGGAVAQVYTRHGGGWYWVKADGEPTVPGPWLGWLLDLAREHGWEG